MSFELTWYQYFIIIQMNVLHTNQICSYRRDTSFREKQTNNITIRVIACKARGRWGTRVVLRGDGEIEFNLSMQQQELSNEQSIHFQSTNKSIQPITACAFI